MPSLQRIAEALQATPTAAYSAPHDYPNAARMFQPAPFAERPRTASEYLRLYVHIPFCNYACSFCCYAKKVGASRDEQVRYVQALKRELAWVQPGTPVSQFFVGGGTPTALPAELLDEVLEAITTRMPNYGDGVHTVEGSPDSVTADHLMVLNKRGVGRLSMGIQSLQDQVLHSVRRGHGHHSALDACRQVIDAGIILNIDLIYGLPGQSEADFRRDFASIAAAGVHAVTAYSLRLNDQTPVARKLSDDERFDLPRLLHWRKLVRDTAREHGYTQTRWHTFKRLDTIAQRHKRLPTTGGDLSGYQFGIGMSARSTLGHTLYRNHRSIVTYMQRIESDRSPVQEIIPIGLEDQRTQLISQTLGDGGVLDAREYEQIFGSSLEHDFQTVFERLQHGGLLEGDASGCYRLTDTGGLLYDLVMLAFYPERAKDSLMAQLGEFQLAQNVGS